jgi:hypothetical protein
MSKVKVKFIKDASGIKEGTEKLLPHNTAQECIALGVAELVEAKKAAPKKAASKKVESKEEK